ncbi:MAG: hypothetical protein ABH879_04820 [archaeon]
MTTLGYFVVKTSEGDVSGLVRALFREFRGEVPFDEFKSRIRGRFGYIPGGEEVGPADLAQHRQKMPGDYRYYPVVDDKVYEAGFLSGQFTTSDAALSVRRLQFH